MDQLYDIIIVIVVVDVIVVVIIITYFASFGDSADDRSQLIKIQTTKGTRCVYLYVLSIAQITSISQANVGPTIGERLGRRQPYNVGPMLFCLLAQHCGPTLGRWPTFRQHWRDVGRMFGWCWANVFGQQFADLLVNFLPTFCHTLVADIPI